MLSLRLLTPPLARTSAIIAAASITHDKGFHIKPRNFKNLFSCNKVHEKDFNNDRNTL